MTRRQSGPCHEAVVQRLLADCPLRASLHQRRQRPCAPARRSVNNVNCSARGIQPGVNILRHWRFLLMRCRRFRIRVRTFCGRPFSSNKDTLPYSWSFYNFPDLDLKNATKPFTVWPLPSKTEVLSLIVGDCMGWYGLSFVSSSISCVNAPFSSPFRPR